MSAKERKIEGFHVEMWDIDRPIDYPKNARKWSPGLEISPAYCDVIVTRWQNLTGKKAVLSAD